MKIFAPRLTERLDETLDEPLSASKVLLLLWPLFVLLTAAGDYFSGAHIQFPILYLIPIAMATWASGRFWGYSLALILPCIRLVYPLIWIEPAPAFDLVVNTIIRIMVFSLFVFLLGWIREHFSRLKEEVRLLKGLLPICAHCKKIRDLDHSWQPIEEYVAKHSEATFSHGICPQCLKMHYGDLIKEIREED